MVDLITSQSIVQNAPSVGRLQKPIPVNNDKVALKAPIIDRVQLSTEALSLVQVEEATAQVRAEVQAKSEVKLGLDTNFGEAA